MASGLHNNNNNSSAVVGTDRAHSQPHKLILLLPSKTHNRSNIFAQSFSKITSSFPPIRPRNTQMRQNKRSDYSLNFHSQQVYYIEPDGKLSNVPNAQLLHRQADPQLSSSSYSSGPPPPALSSTTTTTATWQHYPLEQTKSTDKNVLKFQFPSTSANHHHSPLLLLAALAK